MTVKEALMHPWIKKFDDKQIIDGRKNTKNEGKNTFAAFTSTTNDH